MLFGATHACAICRLRFARAAECPRCGRGRVLALSNPRHRSALAEIALRARVDLSMFARIGTIALLAVLALCAVLKAIGIIVAALMAVVALAGFAVARSTLARRAAAPEPWVLRVWKPAAPSAAREALRGVVRRAAVSVYGPVSGAECVVFGVHGDVDGAPLDDADGADFDLELDGGERVFVSLEHASLVDEDPKAPATVLRTQALDELLAHRSVVEPGAEAVCTLAEVLVRDGDPVTVEGDVKASVALAFGGTGRKEVRVASGQASSPLIVRSVKKEGTRDA
jgi:hypothetical protein